MISIVNVNKFGDSCKKIYNLIAMARNGLITKMEYTE